MTTCHNCFTNQPDCRQCPDRINMHTSLDIEQANAEKALDELFGWVFCTGLIIVALGLIVGAEIWL